MLSSFLFNQKLFGNITDHQCRQPQNTILLCIEKFADLPLYRLQTLQKQVALTN